ncbi:MAG: DUF808 domain-containing protein [Leptospiraceae bacterium]|nr:DUF808 domain-containing protein [Leptospiraceae bacterium]
MAGGLFAVLDDIAMLLDDAAAMSKIATQKTASILSDDLAVNAEQASGFASSRELPVLWAISKGSLLNKFIILPAAFLLSAFASQAIIPILMLGGIYLAFEGAEKIYSLVSGQKQHNPRLESIPEKQKIRSAIITDFILSIEIVIIALDSVAGQQLALQILVVTFVAILATIGIYGIVALLVRMDDAGFALLAWSRHQGAGAVLGRAFIQALPWVIKILGFIGTLAMLLVAGGIYLHHVPWLHNLLHAWPALLAEMLTGTLLGAAAWIVIKPLEVLWHSSKSKTTV